MRRRHVKPGDRHVAGEELIVVANEADALDDSIQSLHGDGCVHRMMAHRGDGLCWPLNGRCGGAPDGGMLCLDGGGLPGIAPGVSRQTEKQSDSGERRERGFLHGSLRGATRDTPAPFSRTYAPDPGGAAIRRVP